MGKIKSQNHLERYQKTPIFAVKYTNLITMKHPP